MVFLFALSPLSLPIVFPFSSPQAANDSKMAAPAASLTSQPFRWAIASWSFFILENTVLSENRTLLISHLGDKNYHACYGLCSTAAMGSVGYAYKMVRNAEPMMWNSIKGAPMGAKVGSFACFTLGLGMMSQMPPKLQIPVEYRGEPVGDSTVQPNAMNAAANKTLSGEQSSGWKVRCPFDFSDNKNPDSNSVAGLERITRHPGLWSFAFLGLGQAFLTPSLPQRVWFAMPTLVALIGGAHTDSRYKRGMGGCLDESYEKITSNVPFWAICSGKQGQIGNVLKDMGEEIKPLNALIAVGAAGVWVLRRGRGIKVV
jgi:uncharacterized membrane protein